MKLRLIRTATEWHALQDQWLELEKASESLTPFNSWGWIRTWWDVFGGEGFELYILTAFRGDVLVAALPLALHMSPVAPWLGPHLRVLRFLSTGERECDEVTTEFFDVICLPGERTAAVETFSHWLFGDGRADWDAIVFDNVLDGSIALTLGTESTAATGFAPIVRNVGYRYWMSLPGSFEEYLLAQGKSRRARIRRARRRLACAGSLLITSFVERSSVVAALERLAGLHNKRWSAAGKSGAFASRKFFAFHYSLVRTSALAPHASVTLLAVDGHDVAGVYSLDFRGVTYFYQAGFDDALGDAHSPGFVAIGHDVERAINSGQRVYDFMRGKEESYKSKFGAQRQSMYQVMVFNRTAKAVLALAHLQLIDLYRRWRKRLVPQD